MLGIRPKERRTQCHFRDDGAFEFRKLDIEESCLVEKRNGVIYKAWALFYKLQLYFKGFANIAPDLVTLAFDRDIILDPFDLLNKDEKPEKGTELGKKWITAKAESMKYKIQHRQPKMQIWDKITLVLGIGFIIELLLLGLVIAVK